MDGGRRPAARCGRDAAARAAATSREEEDNKAAVGTAETAPVGPGTAAVGAHRTAGHGEAAAASQGVSNETAAAIERLRKQLAAKENKTVARLRKALAQEKELLKRERMLVTRERARVARLEKSAELAKRMSKKKGPTKKVDEEDETPTATTSSSPGQERRFVAREARPEEDGVSAGGQGRRHAFQWRRLRAVARAAGVLSVI